MDDEPVIYGDLGLVSLAELAFDVVAQTREVAEPTLEMREMGRVTYVGEGIARVSGLPTVQAEELVRFENGRLGMALNLDAAEVGVVLLDEREDLDAGSKVHRTGRILDVPVGDSLLGRVVDAIGRPIDRRGAIRADMHRPVEREAPAIMDRAPVDTPMQTGLKVVDALIPIGRGQRELILGDRQTGKTAVALDTILNQRETDVYCVYCAIGQRNAAVASVISDLQEHDAMAYTTVVVAGGDEPPGLQFVAPYAATTIAEFYMEAGRDVLIVYDDLTRHARAYRELSLLLRRPPGREAYPGDIFYIHSRLLERATHLDDDHGGGSLTALPVVETEAQNLSAYIPTNLISITDGQIYLSPTLFQKGILPAVDVGRSVSRVGGKAQMPAYRQMAGDLRLSYAQFEELEDFARFGTRLDEDTQRTLQHGRRVREVLKQSQYDPMPVAEQVAVLFATTNGLLDGLDIAQIPEAESRIRLAVRDDVPEICAQIEEGQSLDDAARAALLRVARAAVQSITMNHEAGDGDA
ncbi:F0F1 ATP synthase subunit alpha [Longibacter salinarum]|uniref:ATP synthase subunit alpha n=1 Tax=Longibacter salinarum TaxID=1850348 RepID=A0A2A8D1V3_9BACT|nr:alternate F1F0 ATPase, F1 subunit alpha [Longibacter salinarum]PEN14871.1 F0F1 ATP synthase subunit alpha [Longibacter salinarum]